MVWYSHSELDKDYNLKHGINPGSKTWLRCRHKNQLSAKRQTDVRGRGGERYVGSDIGYTFPPSLFLSLSLSPNMEIPRCSYDKV